MPRCAPIDRPERASPPGRASPKSHKRAERLANAPFDDVLDGDRFEGPDRPRFHPRFEDHSAVPRGERTGHPGVPDLVSGSALGCPDQTPGGPVGDELATQVAERIDRCRFEARHLGEVGAHHRAASGRRCKFVTMNAVSPSPPASAITPFASFCASTLASIEVASIDRTSTDVACAERPWQGLYGSSEALDSPSNAGARREAATVSRERRCIP